MLEDREKIANSKENIKDSSHRSYTDSQVKIMKRKGGLNYCYNSPISVDNKDKIIISQHSSHNENDKKEAGKTIFKKIQESFWIS